MLVEREIPDWEPVHIMLLIRGDAVQEIMDCAAISRLERGMKARDAYQNLKASDVG